MAERHRNRMEYWRAFGDYLRSNDPSFVIRRENRDHWFEFPTGRSGIAISATVSSQKRRIGVELYLHRDPYKNGIRQLALEKSAIEGIIGAKLEWQELPTKRASRIALFLTGVDPFDPTQWVNLHPWMLDKMQRFRKGFASRVKAIDLGPGEDADETADHTG